MPGQVAIGRGPDGRPSGDAWVQLSDEKTAAAAMQAKNRASLGGRYVEIFPSNFQEALRASGGVGLDGYGPAHQRMGGARSQPYGLGAPPPAGYPCGACGAAAGACAGMPGMASWMYPSSYPVGMTMDPAAAAAAAAQYGAAAAQYGQCTALWPSTALQLHSTARQRQLLLRSTMPQPPRSTAQPGSMARRVTA